MPFFLHWQDLLVGFFVLSVVSMTWSECEGSCGYRQAAEWHMGLCWHSAAHGLCGMVLSKRLSGTVTNALTLPRSHLKAVIRQKKLKGKEETIK